MEELNNGKGKKSCTSCKVISISCLIAIGGYLIHTGKHYNGKAKIFTTILGSSSIALGVGEIFDKSPFRN